MVEIKIYSEPITLGQLVKFLGLIYSGGEVKKFLEENNIFVNEISEKGEEKSFFLVI